MKKNSHQTSWPGELVNLEIRDGCRFALTLSPTNNLSKFCHRKTAKNKSSLDGLAYLLEDHLCNGWELVPPDELGWLVSETMPVLRWNNDNGMIFYFEAYAIKDEVNMLVSGKAVNFTWFDPN